MPVTPAMPSWGLDETSGCRCHCKQHKPGRTLQDRWYEFDQSAFGKTYGNHAGGNTCRDEFGVARKPDLYVSALPVGLGDPWYSAFILAAERLLIWEYALRHQHLVRPIPSAWAAHLVFPPKSIRTRATNSRSISSEASTRRRSRIESIGVRVAMTAYSMALRNSRALAPPRLRLDSIEAVRLDACWVPMMLPIKLVRGFRHAAVGPRCVRATAARWCRSGGSLSERAGSDGKAFAQPTVADGARGG